MMCVGRVERGERKRGGKNRCTGRNMKRRDGGGRGEGVGEINSVCLVLAYFKNTVSTKANKLWGGRRER